MKKIRRFSYSKAFLLGHFIKHKPRNMHKSVNVYLCTYYYLTAFTFIFYSFFHLTVYNVLFISATLHAFEVKKLADRLMHFPTWVDLKGQDSVPDTVHHVIVPVNPRQDSSWTNLKRSIQTDGVHAKDRVGAGIGKRSICL